MSYFSKVISSTSGSSSTRANKEQVKSFTYSQATNALLLDVDAAQTEGSVKTADIGEIEIENTGKYPAFAILGYRLWTAEGTMSGNTYQVVHLLRPNEVMIVPDAPAIIVDEDMMVLGGNMRLKASKDAGLKQVWIEIAEGLTEAQKKEFIVKDNVGFGEWEWDMLANEWDSVQLAEWGLDVWQNEDDEQNNDVNDISDNIAEEYRVEIELTSEREQEQVYNELTKKGYKCRILTF